MRLAGLPGHLRKIEVVNFMCHEHFTMEFGQVGRYGCWAEPAPWVPPVPAGRCAASVALLHPQAFRRPADLLAGALVAL